MGGFKRYRIYDRYPNGEPDDLPKFKYPAHKVPPPPPPEPPENVPEVAPEPEPSYYDITFYLWTLGTVALVVVISYYLYKNQFRKQTPWILTSILWQIQTSPLFSSVLWQCKSTTKQLYIEFVSNIPVSLSRLFPQKQKNYINHSLEPTNQSSEELLLPQQSVMDSLSFSDKLQSKPEIRSLYPNRPRSRSSSPSRIPFNCSTAGKKEHFGDYDKPPFNCSTTGKKELFGDYDKPPFNCSTTGKQELFGDYDKSPMMFKSTSVSPPKPTEKQRNNSWADVRNRPGEKSPVFSNKPKDDLSADSIFPKEPNGASALSTLTSGDVSFKNNAESSNTFDGDGEDDTPMPPTIRSSLLKQVDCTDRRVNNSPYRPALDRPTTDSPLTELCKKYLQLSFTDPHNSSVSGSDTTLTIQCKKYLQSSPTDPQYGTRPTPVDAQTSPIKCQMSSLKYQLSPTDKENLTHSSLADHQKLTPPSSAGTKTFIEAFALSSTYHLNQKQSHPMGSTQNEYTSVDGIQPSTDSACHDASDRSTKSLSRDDKCLRKPLVMKGFSPKLKTANRAGRSNVKLHRPLDALEKVPVREKSSSVPPKPDVVKISDRNFQRPHDMLRTDSEQSLTHRSNSVPSKSDGHVNWLKVFGYTDRCCSGEEKTCSDSEKSDWRGILKNTALAKGCRDFLEDQKNKLTANISEHTPSVKTCFDFFEEQKNKLSANISEHTPTVQCCYDFLEKQLSPNFSECTPETVWECTPETGCDYLSEGQVKEESIKFSENKTAAKLQRSQKKNNKSIHNAVPPTAIRAGASQPTKTTSTKLKSSLSSKSAVKHKTQVSSQPKIQPKSPANDKECDKSQNRNSEIISSILLEDNSSGDLSYDNLPKKPKPMIRSRSRSFESGRPTVIPRSSVPLRQGGDNPGCMPGNAACESDCQVEGMCDVHLKSFREVNAYKSHAVSTASMDIHPSKKSVQTCEKSRPPIRPRSRITVRNIDKEEQIIK